MLHFVAMVKETLHRKLNGNKIFIVYDDSIQFMSLRFKSMTSSFTSRFKENNIIDKELYSFNNTLKITAERGLNGSYRCRVVNDFGSEFSDGAVLKIIGRHLVLTLVRKKIGRKLILVNGWPI